MHYVRQRHSPKANQNYPQCPTHSTRQHRTRNQMTQQHARALTRLRNFCSSCLLARCCTSLSRQLSAPSFCSKEDISCCWRRFARIALTICIGWDEHDNQLCLNALSQQQSAVPQFSYQLGSKTFIYCSVIRTSDCISAAVGLAAGCSANTKENCLCNSIANLSMSRRSVSQEGGSKRSTSTRTCSGCTAFAAQLTINRHGCRPCT